MRFAIRELLWLMVVVAVCLAWLTNTRRWNLMEAKMKAAEQHAARSNARYDAIAKENKTTSAVFEALAEAYRKMPPSAEQQEGFGEAFKEELKIRGVEVTVGCSLSSAPNRQ